MLEAATLVLLVRKLVVQVLEAARDVIRRCLDERHHVLRPVRGEAVAHVLRVRALLRTERLGERRRDGTKLGAPRRSTAKALPMSRTNSAHCASVQQFLKRSGT